MGEIYQMQVMDRGWTELALPQGLGGNYKIIADNVVNAQTSLIKIYIAVIVIMGGLILGIIICL